MKTVILSSSPFVSQSYEQGIEVALNLAEAEIGVRVLLAGDFARAIKSSKAESIFVKKLKQLELFDIPCLTPSDPIDNFDDGALTF